MGAFQTVAWAPWEALGSLEGQEGSPLVSHSKQNNSTFCLNQWVPGKILFESEGSTARMPHQVILKISFMTQRFPNQDHIQWEAQQITFRQFRSFLHSLDTAKVLIPRLHAPPQCHPIHVLPYELTFEVIHYALPLTFHSPFFFTFFITSCMISKKERKRKEGRRERGKMGEREGRKEEKKFNVISRTSNPCLWDEVIFPP